MLSAFLALNILMQGGAAQQSQRPTVVRDSMPPGSAAHNAPRRLPVTAALLATAFHDPAARELFNRARVARLAQDSSLQSYDSKVKQRLSVLLGIGKLGRDRLVFRQESAARVRWQRDAGVRVDVTAGRVAIPPLGSPKTERDALQESALDNDGSPIPYFPGSENLLISDLAAKTDVNERELVNPLARGAEAYYTFRTGDSLSFRLPDGHVVQLRELEFRPRVAKPNVVVGSLWFDIATGQLVRAAYRLAIPAEMKVTVTNDAGDSVKTPIIAKLLKTMVQPLTADLSAIVVEYGLYGGRFWLPRSQSIEGSAQALLARVPMKLETSFSYASVNEPLGLTPIHVDTTAFDEQWRAMPPPALDSAARKHWLDSARVAYNAAFKARRDSLDKGLKVGSMRQCDTAATRVETRYRSEAKIPVEMRVPCDLDKLLASSDLPPSIFDPGDDVFGSAEAERLAAAALGMGVQAPLSLGNLPAPRVQLGPSMTRYNRVEGFSTGALYDQQLGAGLSATAIGRFGFADKRPNFELSLARSDFTKTIRVNGYTRLVSANDWGSPLNFSSSLGALFFGRDEGFYYRATGGELLWTVERGPRLEVRAFSEQQRNAPQNTTANLGATFIPNIESANVTSTGASLRYLGSFGQDIRGWRAFTDLRLEGAGGDSSYGRAALDVTLSKAILRRVDAALTLGGGTTTGHVPAQRRWFLGGTQTIRGQAADTAQSGTAFWMTRMELARSSEFMRTVLFGDLGWAGDREKWGEFGRPLSGAGVGFSFLDGLVRFDAARGIYPRKDMRFAFYFNAPF
jgi:hypothetical protein